jgi:hypothetical protein
LKDAANKLYSMKSPSVVANINATITIGRASLPDSCLSILAEAMTNPSRNNKRV